MSRYSAWNSPWHTLTITEIRHYHYDNNCLGHEHKPEGESEPEIEWELVHPEECPINSNRCCCRGEPVKLLQLAPEQRCPDCSRGNHENCYRCYPRCDVEMEFGEHSTDLPREVGTYRVRIANAGRDYWGEYDYDVEIEKVEEE